MVVQLGCVGVVPYKQVGWYALRTGAWKRSVWQHEFGCSCSRLIFVCQVSQLPCLPWLSCDTPTSPTSLCNPTASFSWRFHASNDDGIHRAHSAWAERWTGVVTGVQHIGHQHTNGLHAATIEPAGVMWRLLLYLRPGLAAAARGPTCRCHNEARTRLRPLQRRGKLGQRRAPTCRTRRLGVCWAPLAWSHYSRAMARSTLDALCHGVPRHRRDPRVKTAAAVDVAAPCLRLLRLLDKCGRTLRTVQDMPRRRCTQLRMGETCQVCRRVTPPTGYLGLHGPHPRPQQGHRAAQTRNKQARAYSGDGARDREPRHPPCHARRVPLTLPITTRPASPSQS